MSSAPPTVLTVCNRYRERGGEEVVFEAEAELLERHGWRVERLTAQSREPGGIGDRLRLARDSFWSPGWHRRLAERLARRRPDLVHLHNTFPRISPSVVHACRAAGVPVVHTLHNYRLLCTAATLLRDGRPCQDCLGRAPWPALLHRCYQGSLARTAVAAGATAFHRLQGSWARGVELFITPTEHARRVFVAGGLPAARLAVKPNFVHPDPGTRAGRGEYALFVGRLSPEKGVEDLLAAWRDLDVPLRIVGSGPLAAAVQDQANRRSPVEYLGWRDRAEVLEILRRARFLVFPSRARECGPLAVLEAFACGVPVLAAAGGAAEEMIAGAGAGWLFPAGEPEALAALAGTAWADPAAIGNRGRRARLAFERNYTAEINYRALDRLYRRVLGRALPAARDNAAEIENAAG